MAGSAVKNSPTTTAGNYVAGRGEYMTVQQALGPPLNFRITVHTEDPINIGTLDQNSQ